MLLDGKPEILAASQQVFPHYSYLTVFLNPRAMVPYFDQYQVLFPLLQSNFEIKKLKSYDLTKNKFYGLHEASLCSD